jgi:hypothetical protein
VTTLGSSSIFADCRQVATLTTSKVFPDVINERVQEYAKQHEYSWKVIKRNDLVNGIISDDCKLYDGRYKCTMNIIDEIDLEDFWREIAILLKIPLTQVQGNN